MRKLGQLIKILGIIRNLNSTNKSGQNKYDDQILKKSGNNYSIFCQGYFTLVSRGAKPAKLNELNESITDLNVSNRFTMLEIEPCLDSFDCENVYEDQSLDKPATIKTHKRKKFKKIKKKI